MARYAGAFWRPVTRYLPGGSSAQRSPGMRRLIFHTAVTSATSLWSSMNTPGTPTSHFYLAGNGHMEQYIDTQIMSSANLEGNPDCITIETQDMGSGFPPWSGSDVPRWTKEQVEALAALAAWCHRTHGIPLVQLPSSRPGTTGVGWHRLGIDGNFPQGLLSGRAPGGEQWSSSAGKVCPGDNRIKQVVSEVLPLARGNGEDDDMQLSDKVRGDQTVRDALIAALNVETRLSRFRAATRKAFEELEAEVSDDATKAQVRRMSQRLSAKLDEAESTQ